MFTPKLFSSLKTYSRTLFYSDLVAGLTVGIVALPLAMAFAIASGLPPEKGIFTAIVGGFIISALGGSRVQIGGPTGAFVIIVAGVVQEYGYESLIYCMLLAGGFLIALGLFKMGSLIKFIPFPVTTGFTTGIAVVIFSTQIKDLFGLRMDDVPADFIDKLVSLVYHFNTLSLTATSLGIATILIIVILRKYYPRLPGMLIALLVVTLTSVLFDLEVETIGSRFGELPRMLPSPSIPPFDFERFKGLISPAFTIGLLAAIESLLSATVADGMIGGRHRPNMELIAQGAANIGTAIFGGIPATGAIARTATNVKSGGKTPVAGIIHAATILLLLLLVAPYAKLIPLTALAGILAVVSYNMSEIKHFLNFRKAPRSDFMVLLTTFALTVFIDLTVAVEVGVVLAALLFIRRMSEVSNVGIITKEIRGDDMETADPNSIFLRDVPDGVEVFEIQGPFFFGAADRFKEAMRLVEKPVPVIILRVRQVPAIDATGLHALKEFHQNVRANGSHLILSGVHAQPMFAMQRDGLYDQIGMENMFGNIDDALNRAREILGLPKVSRPVPFVPTVKREEGRVD